MNRNATGDASNSKMKKTVKQLIPHQEVMMGSAKMGQPIPSRYAEQVSPFILLHHWGPKYTEPGSKPMDIGPHPHRGFEPVSFVFKGEVSHKDSLGNEGVVGPGGVQWMTAGRGIVHAEGSPSSFYENGGDSEMIQLWINLPASKKMVTPNYQKATRDEIPYVEKENARVNVISGEWNGTKGPIDSLTGIQSMTFELKAGGELNLDIPEGRHVLLYQLNGDTVINGQQVGDKEMVQFDNQGTEIQIEANKETVILFLTGEPIDEPMVSHGPFVMNTTTEIMEAVRDYQVGKMGVMTEY